MLSSAVAFSLELEKSILKIALEGMNNHEKQLVLRLNFRREYIPESPRTVAEDTNETLPPCKFVHTALHSMLITRYQLVFRPTFTLIRFPTPEQQVVPIEVVLLKSFMITLHYCYHHHITYFIQYLVVFLVAVLTFVTIAV